MMRTIANAVCSIANCTLTLSFKPFSTIVYRLVSSISTAVTAISIVVLFISSLFIKYTNKFFMESTTIIVVFIFFYFTIVDLKSQIFITRLLYYLLIHFGCNFMLLHCYLSLLYFRLLVHSLFICLLFTSKPFKVCQIFKINAICRTSIGLFDWQTKRKNAIELSHKNLKPKKKKTNAQISQRKMT